MVFSVLSNCKSRCWVSSKYSSYVLAQRSCWPLARFACRWALHVGFVIYASPSSLAAHADTCWQKNVLKSSDWEAVLYFLLFLFDFFLSRNFFSLNRGLSFWKPPSTLLLAGQLPWEKTDFLFTAEKVVCLVGFLSLYTELRVCIYWYEHTLTTSMMYALFESFHNKRHTNAHQEETFKKQKEKKKKKKKQVWCFDELFVTVDPHLF